MAFGARLGTCTVCSAGAQINGACINAFCHLDNEAEPNTSPVTVLGCQNLKQIPTFPINSSGRMFYVVEDAAVLSL